MIQYGKKCESNLRKHKFLRLPFDDAGRPVGRNGQSRWGKRIKDFLFEIEIYPQSSALTWVAQWRWIKTSHGLWDEAKAEEDLCELEHEGSTAEELDELISNAKRILRNSPRFKKRRKLQLPSTRRLLGIEIK